MKIWWSHLYVDGKRASQLSWGIVISDNWLKYANYRELSALTIYNNRRTLACYLVHKQSLFSHPVLVRLQSFEQVECSWAFCSGVFSTLDKTKKADAYCQMACNVLFEMFNVLFKTVVSYLLELTIGRSWLLSVMHQPPPCDCQSFTRQLGLQGTGPFASPVTGNISDIGLFPEPSDICLFPELSGTSQHPSNKLHCLFSVQNQFGPPLDPSKLSHQT